MRFKVLQDFIYEDGRISAGEIVDLPIEKVAHLIESGKIEPAVHEGGAVETATIEPLENAMVPRKKKWGLGNAGK